MDENEFMNIEDQFKQSLRKYIDACKEQSMDAEERIEDILADELPLT